MKLICMYHVAQRIIAVNMVAWKQPAILIMSLHLCCRCMLLTRYILYDSAAAAMPRTNSLTSAFIGEYSQQH